MLNLPSLGNVAVQQYCSLHKDRLMDEFSYTYKASCSLTLYVLQR